MGIWTKIATGIARAAGLARLTARIDELERELELTRRERDDAVGESHELAGTLADVVDALHNDSSWTERYGYGQAVEYARLVRLRHDRFDREVRALTRRVNQLSSQLDKRELAPNPFEGADADE